MPVGPESPCRHVVVNGLRPRVYESIRAAKVLDEFTEDPLDASGSALVLEAGDVLIEPSLGQPALPALPTKAFGLVVAEAALGHPG
jgi:hypothetical protein